MPGEMLKSSVSAGTTPFTSSTPFGLTCTLWSNGG
jgi:hypothetical protein